jgi:DNA-binding transcriptional ArsR family regulator
MSRHLRLLRQGGVVESEFLAVDARVRMYRLRPEALAGLRNWLEGLDAHWGEQLHAFKAHVERKAKGNR